MSDQDLWQKCAAWPKRWPHEYSINFDASHPMNYFMFPVFFKTKVRQRSNMKRNDWFLYFTLYLSIAGKICFYLIWCLLRSKILKHNEYISIWSSWNIYDFQRMNKNEINYVFIDFIKRHYICKLQVTYSSIAFDVCCV